MLSRRNFCRSMGAWLLFSLTGCRVIQPTQPRLQARSQSVSVGPPSPLLFLDLQPNMDYQVEEVFGRNGLLLTELSVNGISRGVGDYRFYINGELLVGSSTSIDQAEFDPASDHLRIERRYGLNWQTVYNFQPVIQRPGKSKDKITDGGT